MTRRRRTGLVTAIVVALATSLVIWASRSDGRLARTEPRGAPAADATSPPARAMAAEGPLVEGAAARARPGDSSDSSSTRPLLRGRAIDQHSAPVAHCPIAVLARPSGANVPTRFVEGASFDATTTTDGDGRFRIVDLPAGDYWLGPNPNVLRGVAAEAVAPIGATVTLPPDDEEVVLHLSRGLFIRGRVLDSSGAGRALSVRATWQAGTATAKWTSSASSDGRFEVGPLPSGEFGLRIEGPPWNADPGEPARAFAGEDDVVLRVTGWGRISGRVLDPSGSPAAAHVLVSCDVQAFVTFDADKRALRVKQEVPTNAQGEFEADGLGPGQYSLSAESDDGFVSVVRTVALARGESKPDVELRLEATATLVVELGEPLRYGRLEAFRDGVPVPIGAIWGAPTARLRLPAGDLVVRVMGPSPPGAAEVVAAEAHVVLAPNEKASIALRAR